MRGNAHYRETPGRLREIKTKVDPGRSFNFPQTIPLTR